MKRSFVIILLLLFASFLAFFKVGAQEKLIAHPNLEEAIKYQLGIDSKVEISKEQLESVSEVDGSWWGIPDLTGIGNAINLTSLYLEGNEIVNISNLSALIDLENLVLTDNRVEDINPLSSYRNLSTLDLRYNNIKDISALSSVSFTGASGGVGLAHNQIEDLTPLSETAFPEETSYFFVDVSYNKLKSINGLQNIKGVTELSAANNELLMVQELSSLLNLEYLDLSNNHITSIQSLINSHPKVIKMANNSLETLLGLQVNTEEAYYFEFQNNQINNIDSLAEMTEGYINLENNNISDISALKNIEKGQVLLKGNPLSPNALEVIGILEMRGVKVSYDPIDTSKFSKLRIAGKNRYQTAVEISKIGWPENANTVVIARGDSFPDALAGVPLAFKKDAPILLTEAERLNPETQKEIKNLGASSAIILGGTNAISVQVESTLVAMGLEVKRIAGSNRFETARKIAEEIGASPKKAVIAYGYNFPDALAIASYAAQNQYPILLTDYDKLPKETAEYLTNVEQTLVVGGEGVVSNEIMQELPKAERIGGDNRFDTAAKVIELLEFNTDQIFLANGFGFADSLTGSILAAKQNASILLLEKNVIPRETSDILTKYNISSFTVLGGNEVISDTVVQRLKEKVE